MVKGVADDGIPAAAVAKGQTEANAGPGEGGDPHHHDAHPHRVEHIASLDEASIEEGQSWSHQQHHGGADQDQAVVRSSTAVGRMGGEQGCAQELQCRNAKGRDAQAPESGSHKNSVSSDTQ